MKICIVGTIQNRKISNINFELLGLAQNLNPSAIDLVLLSENPNEYLEEVQGYGVKNIILIEYNGEESYSNWANAYYEYFKSASYDLVLFSQNDDSINVASRLSALLKSGIISNVSNIENNGNLEFTRISFGSQVESKIFSENGSIALVQKGLGIDVKRTSHKSNVINITYNANTNLELLDISKKIVEEVDISKAKVIVAGGLGLKKKEDLNLLRELAELLNGEIAVTRPVVELGWVDRSYQIGQTGINVKPNVYIGCGISGAIQHKSGMIESKKIIAINKNPNAKIFEFADHGLVGDLYEIMPNLIKMIKKEKNMV